MTSSAIKVLIVEDEPTTALGLQCFIEELQGIEIVGIAVNGEDALKMDRDIQPDIVLLDIGLPGMNGISVARQIKKRVPQRRVIMLTGDSSNEAVFASFDAGADGYVLKSLFQNSLNLAIHTVCCGSVWLDPQIAQTILQMAIDAPDAGYLALSKHAEGTLNELAGSKCDDGVCLVEHSFVEELRRFRPSGKSPAAI